MVILLCYLSCWYLELRLMQGPLSGLPKGSKLTIIVCCNYISAVHINQRVSNVSCLTGLESLIGIVFYIIPGIAWDAKFHLIARPLLGLIIICQV
ncbi:hypothetical protein CEXT_683311 [Caerostris extrusa]|uniref:Uncharacterized protein n=1 Tax=Caerostris extrusa TaxID=172846 RepID=A0AAV4XL45_CAEEX|nr:hypothetical protein CEXT_683311 [Caerostris extrusa]